MFAFVVVVICGVAVAVCLTLYQDWIFKYEDSLTLLDETKQGDKIFWGEANVIVQSLFLTIINIIFEEIFIYLSEYERWDQRPYFHQQVVFRLTNLEFFVTAVMAPVILSLVKDYKTFFMGAASGEIKTSKLGEFEDTWYNKHGFGMFIQLFVYFLVQSWVIPFLINIIPTLLKQRRDRRQDYTDRERALDMPNTKKHTQSDLQRLYMNSQFDVNMKYIYFYVTLLISMMFSGTTFCLYPCAMIIYGIGYLLDKTLMLRFHTKSKSFNEVFHTTTYLFYVPCACLLHLAFSIYGFYHFNLQMELILAIDPGKKWLYLGVQVGLVIFVVLLREIRICYGFAKDFKKEMRGILRRRSSSATNDRASSNNFLREISPEELADYYYRFKMELKYCQMMEKKELQVQTTLVKRGLEANLTNIKKLVHEYSLALVILLEMKKEGKDFNMHAFLRTHAD